MAHEDRAGSRAWPAALAAAVSAIFSLAFIWRASVLVEGRRYFTLFDDAFVSMRYARSLASGHGLVWNAGEYVEGYTNPLWTLWMAVLHLTGLADRLVPLAVSLTGVALIIGSVLLTYRLALLLAPEDRRVAIASAVLVAFCYPLLYWTLRGMEVGLVVFLMLAAVNFVATVERPRVGLACVMLALLTLTRADALVCAVAIGAGAALALPSAPRRDQLLLCATPLLVFALQELWRHWYYGEWLPNTYYLKVSGVPLAVRLRRGIEMLRPALWSFVSGARPFPKSSIAVPLAVAIAAAALARLRWMLVVIGVPILLVAYSAYVGGDAWEWMPVTNRYVTPALPFVFIAASATVMAVSRWFSRSAASTAIAVAGVVVLGAIVSSAGFADWTRTGGSHVADDQLMTRFGVRIAETTGPDTRIGVVWAGTVPYFSRRPAVDLLGKADPVIARRPPSLPFYPGHDRFDYRFSLSERRPDVVLQLWSPTADTFAALREHGYVSIGSGGYARPGADVNVPELAAALKAASAAFPTYVEPN